MPDSTFYRMEEVGHRNRGWGHPRYKSVASHRWAMSRLSLELEVPRRKVNCACLATPLAGLTKPKVAIPFHYDMFPHNDTDPQLFRRPKIQRPRRALPAA